MPAILDSINAHRVEWECYFHLQPIPGTRHVQGRCLNFLVGVRRLAPLDPSSGTAPHFKARAQDQSSKLLEAAGGRWPLPLLHGPPAGSVATAVKLTQYRPPEHLLRMCGFLGQAAFIMCTNFVCPGAEQVLAAAQFIFIDFIFVLGEFSSCSGSTTARSAVGRGRTPEAVVRQHQSDKRCRRADCEFVAAEMIHQGIRQANAAVADCIASFNGWPNCQSCTLPAAGKAGRQSGHAVIRLAAGPLLAWSTLMRRTYGKNINIEKLFLRRW